MKLHTGRSRNDQVATDMRLWMNENLKILERNLQSLIKAYLSRAESEIDVLMPGYTHLQRAQTIRFSHLLLSYISALDRDFDRLKQLQSRVNICPLGR
jgi:argininosuccinate lyase